MEQYLSVSQLTRYIARKFERDPYLDRVYLKGEISNYNSRRRGQTQYLSIKDEQAIISAVLFNSSARKLKFELEEGMSVLIEGRVSVYERGGNYQIIIDNMQPDGVGALYLAYEQTKEKLSKEGLFSADLKKPIPKYPKRIGVITSQTGAVIQDILTTVKRRYPIAEVVLFPTVVQGEMSADSIVRSIERAEKMGNFDTLIVGRGGGSFEDLFSFNEEKVVRAIAKANTPIISSVGHETDTTLTDLVADLRAATPTAAAELAVPVLTEELIRLDEYEQRMLRVFQAKIQYLNSQLQKVTSSIIFRQPKRLYDGYMQNVDQLEMDMINRIENILRDKKQLADMRTQRLQSLPLKAMISEKQNTVDYLTTQLERTTLAYLKDKNYKIDSSIRALDHLSPLKILDRGYAVVEQEDKVVKRVGDLQVGEQISVRMTDGFVKAKIEEKQVDKE